MLVAWTGASALSARPAEAQYFQPSQIRTAYNVTGSAYTGSGQTIAIVDSGNDATALSDANKFSSTYGLTQFNGSGGPTLTVVGQTGTTSLPANTTDIGETSLDIQWAHAIAPQANIVLVEANSLNDSDLIPAINTAKGYAGVSAVSMSFGGGEYNGEQYTTNYSYAITDGTFAAPSNHIGVTFLASTGDSGTQSYPATSSLVLAVGGTSLHVNGSNVRTSETVWNNTTDGTRGSGSTGAGVSAYEAKPTYQAGIGNSLSTSNRIDPDVVWNADPYTGQYVEVGGTLDSGYGGTSISCPQWAGVIAMANQARVANGLPTLSGTDAMSGLYSIYTKYYGNGNTNASSPTSYAYYFYDVTSGAANGYAATAGYDGASGLGSPNVADVVSYLATFSAPEPTSLLLAAVAAGPLLAARHRRQR